MGESRPQISGLVRPKLWTIEDLAEYLNLAPKWIYNRTKRAPTQGDAIPHLKMGRLIRFDPEAEDFQAWLRGHARGIDRVTQNN
jgi:hypothetical protein